jgi:hypothetical protein
MFLGIDLGTSEVKLLLLDEHHRIVATTGGRLTLQRRDRCGATAPGRVVDRDDWRSSSSAASALRWARELLGLDSEAAPTPAQRAAAPFPCLI